MVQASQAEFAIPEKREKIIGNSSIETGSGCKRKFTDEIPYQNLLIEATQLVKTGTKAQQQYKSKETIKVINTSLKKEVINSKSIIKRNHNMIIVNSEIPTKARKHTIGAMHNTQKICSAWSSLLTF